MSKNVADIEQVMKLRFKRYDDHSLFMGILFGVVSGVLAALFFPLFLSVETLRLPLIVTIATLIYALIIRGMKSFMLTQQINRLHSLIQILFGILFSLSCLSMFLSGWAITFGLAVVVGSF